MFIDISTSKICIHLTELRSSHLHRRVQHGRTCTHRPKNKEPGVHERPDARGDSVNKRKSWCVFIYFSFIKIESHLKKKKKSIIIYSFKMSMINIYFSFYFSFLHLLFLILGVILE